MLLNESRNFQREGMMNNNDNIYLLHEQYSSFLNGYYLLGSSDIWIPYFKKDIEVTYISEENLNVVEEFIGKCIQRDINKKSDIATVLSLKETFLNSVIEPLIKQNFFKIADDQETIYFSDEGEKLFNEKIKYMDKKGTFPLLFDGLNKTNKIEYLESKNKGFNRAGKIKHGILIDGRNFPIYEDTVDYQRLSKYFLSTLQNRRKDTDEEANTSSLINIKNFKYLPNKELLYRKYFLLIYANEEREFEVLVLDPTTGLIQEEFSSVLKKRVVKGYFDDYFDLEAALKEHEELIKTIAEQAAQIEDSALDLNDNIEGREIAGGNLQLIETEVLDSIKYIMNEEIRRLFSHYLKTAQKSLYIISPWMNYHIVSPTFKKDVEKLLMNGVKIRIIYGITDGNNANFNDRDKRSKKIADELNKIGEKYDGLLKVQNGNTHEKMLICDDKYYINGSYNLLSYDAEDNVKGQKGFRNEGSTYMESPIMAQSVINQRFDF